MQNRLSFPAIYPALFLLFFCGFYFQINEFLNDPDTGWHIAAGNYYLKNGLSLHDPFAYTNNGFNWLNISWLWDVGTAVLHNIGGLYFVALASIFIALALILLLFRVASANANLLATLLVVVFGSFSFMPAFLARPHLLAMLLLLIFYKLAKNGRYIFLPLIMLLWVNIHGSFVAGFTILGAYFLQELLSKQYKKSFLICIMGMLCLVVTLINPLGIDIYLASYRTLGGEFRNYITEWQPMSKPEHFIFPVLSLLLIIWNIRRTKMADLMLYFFWLVMNLATVRYMSIFVLLAVAPTAQALSSFSLIQRRASGFENDFSNMKLFKLLSIISAIVVLVALVFPRQIYFDAEKFPVTEADYLFLHIHEGKYFNAYDFGGYLIYKYDQHASVFIDGRAETAYPQNIVADYLNFTLVRNNWRQIPERYGFRYALLKKDEKLAIQLAKNGWVEIFRGPVAIILKNPEN